MVAMGDAASEYVHSSKDDSAAEMLNASAGKFRVWKCKETYVSVMETIVRDVCAMEMKDLQGCDQDRMRRFAKNRLRPATPHWFDSNWPLLAVGRSFNGKAIERNGRRRPATCKCTSIGSDPKFSALTQM